MTSLLSADPPHRLDDARRRAIEGYYRTYAEILVHRIHHRVPGDVTAAENAVQDIFRTLIQRPGVLDQGEEVVQRWLFGAAYFRSVHLRRAPYRRREDLPAQPLEDSPVTLYDSGDADPDAALDRRLNFERFCARPLVALRDHNEHWATAVWLRFVEGMKVREIADRMECPQPSVATFLRLGQQFLVKWIETNQPGWKREMNLSLEGFLSLVLLQDIGPEPSAGGLARGLSRSRAWRWPRSGKLGVSSAAIGAGLATLMWVLVVSAAPPADAMGAGSNPGRGSNPGHGEPTPLPTSVVHVQAATGPTSAVSPRPAAAGRVEADRVVRLAAPLVRGRSPVPAPTSPAERSVAKAPVVAVEDSGAPTAVLGSRPGKVPGREGPDVGLPDPTVAPAPLDPAAFRRIHDVLPDVGTAGDGALYADYRQARALLETARVIESGKGRLSARPELEDTAQALDALQPRVSGSLARLVATDRAEVAVRLGDGDGPLRIRTLLAGEVDAHQRATLLGMLAIAEARSGFCSNLGSVPDGQGGTQSAPSKTRAACRRTAVGEAP